MPPLTSTRPGSILALNWFHSVLFKPNWRLFLSTHPGVDPCSQRFTEYNWACWFLPVLAVRKASGIRPAGRSPSPSCIWEGCWCAECSWSHPSFSGSFCTTQRRRIRGLQSRNLKTRVIFLTRFPTNWTKDAVGRFVWRCCLHVRPTTQSEIQADWGYVSKLV